MRAAKMAPILGISALLVCALAAPSRAQDGVRQRAPIIRVYSENGPDVIGTTTYEFRPFLGSYAGSPDAFDSP